MRRTSHENEAWAAGLFDGEGSICIRRDGRIELVIQSTDMDLVNRFHSVVGFGAVRGPYMPKGGRKQTWHWATASRGGVVGTIRTLLPWLGERRRAKAREALLALGERVPK